MLFFYIFLFKIKKLGIKYFLIIIHYQNFCSRDKAVKEEEHNEKNKHYFLPDDHFGRKTLNVAQTQYEGIYK